jgi:hypothetical protein
MEPAEIVPLLQPLRVPEPVSWWPPAPGWWILAAVLLLLVGAAVTWLLRRWRRRAPLRAARAELKALRETNGAPAATAARLSALWRRVALHCADDGRRPALAAATGEAFLEELNRLGGAECRSLQLQWAQLAYVEDTDPQQIAAALAGTERWLALVEKRQ